MGKTIKKVRQGAQRPHRGTPSVSEVIAGYAEPSVTCPRCLIAASRSDYEDKGGDRFKCPTCGAVFDRAEFARRFFDLRRGSRGTFEHERRINREIEEAHSVEEAIPVAFIREAYSRRRVVPLEHEAEVVGRRADAKREMVGSSRALGASAYYLSEWYALSGVPLQVRGRSGYNLEPRFDLGHASVIPADYRPRSWAVYAEWLVFEHLRRALADEEGLLAGMELCANLYLDFGDYARRFDEDGVGLRPLYRQVDLIAMSEHAVYIIEVKSYKGDIQVDGGGVAVLTRSDGSRTALKGDMRQCAGHASAFADRYPFVAYDRVFELTVYANPETFTGGRADFIDNALVSTCSADAAPFVDAISRQEVRLAAERPVFTGRQLRDLAEAIRSSYGDPLGVKARRHIERLEEIRRERRERSGNAPS